MNGRRLLNVPYIEQMVGYCGPASLAMALQFYGMDVGQENIGKKIMSWQNADAYSFTCSFYELERYAKECGFDGSFWSEGQTIPDLVKSIDEGIPPVILQWPTSKRSFRHFRIVIGYDGFGESIILHDPDPKYVLFPDYRKETRDFMLINKRTFCDLWDTGGKGSIALYVRK